MHVQKHINCGWGWVFGFVSFFSIQRAVSLFKGYFCVCLLLVTAQKLPCSAVFIFILCILQAENSFFQYISACEEEEIRIRTYLNQMQNWNDILY